MHCGMSSITITKMHTSIKTVKLNVFFVSVAPIDYDGVISELVFNTGDSRVCYTISIVDDDLCEEPSENLLAQLRVQNENSVEYRLEFTEVVIEDDAEPECG